MAMEINLGNRKWQVKGFWPYIPLLGNSIETGNELMGVTDWMDAAVPGGVHWDLLKAGVIEDPYFELNSLACEWVENRWWMYRTTFQIPAELRGRKLMLIFKGVDYKAHFYFNKRKLGEHEGMFEPAGFDISENACFGEDNTLEVLFESVPDEMSQIGYTSKTHTQKSRFAYKWDWCTRLVNIGFWDDVILRVTGGLSIDETYIHTDVAGDTGIIHVFSAISGDGAEKASVRYILSYDGKIIHELEENLETDKYEEQPGNRREAEACFKVLNPELWYPNGAGGQPLYDLVIQVLQDGRLSDEKSYRTGIRKLEYRNNQDGPEDALPYTVVINGSPVYIKGVNLTPFDQMYGTVGEETYDRYLSMIRLANINLVRVNGIGVIEKESFYRLCDKYGILVWQDFIQSSSGIENVPSSDPEFLELLKKTALYALKTRRNHVSHTIWCGGNELADVNRVPITWEHPNIAMLKELTNKHDPGKLFLPSTASGPIYILDTLQPGKNHDVHGSWKYEGIEKHYRLYNDSDCLFHSEFGCDGMSCPESLKRFLKPENVRITNVSESLVWRHHGEWWDTLSRDESIFGAFKHLEDYVKASQFMQAEGIRYIIEANRRRKFRNSGSIIWQFNEAWPNVSGTYLVDYYGNAKMAYYWARDAFEPVHASLKYEKLFYPAEERFTGEVYLHNSLAEEKKVTVRYEVLDIHGRILYTEAAEEALNPNSTRRWRNVEIALPGLDTGIFFVRLQNHQKDGKKYCSNLYVFSQRKEKIFEPLTVMEKAKLSISKTDCGYSIRNDGPVVALFVHAACANAAFSYTGSDFCTLFPGEETIFTRTDAVSGKRTDECGMEFCWFNEPQERW